MLFTEEVKDINELTNLLINYPSIHKIKVCVIAMIFDKDGKLILHRRGLKARDEIGKLEAIGGSVNKSDKTFRDAIERELIEETGPYAKYEVNDFIGAVVSTKMDNHTNELIDWIVLAYHVNLLDGEMINMEKERCDGFESNYIKNFNRDEVADSCYTVMEYLSRKEE